MENEDQQSPRLALGAPRFCGAAPDPMGVAMRLAELEGAGEEAPFRGGLFTVAPGATSRPDNHAVHEIWMVARGRGTLHYAEQTLSIAEGDVLRYAPHHTHQVHNEGPEDLVIFALWWPSERGAAG